MNTIPVELIRKLSIFPYEENQKEIFVYSSKELTKDEISELAFFGNKKVHVSLLTEEEILAKIRDTYGLSEKLNEIVHQTDTHVREESMNEDNEEIESTQVKILDLILRDAIQVLASDIHLEKTEMQVKVKMRIDGVLQDRETFPIAYYDQIISRVKIISRLDIGERRLPQDGKFLFKDKQDRFDIRVSLLPGYFGEGCVMRILYKNVEHKSLQELGFYTEDAELLLRHTQKPSGLLIVNGPTGSGKTTTLYSLLNMIRVSKRKIITLEDPIEYLFEDALQLQVKPEIGFDFSIGLRSILRHDPDVILVGEIRDSETADIALRSALTGHLVLSTLHTNDNPTSILRLLDLGADPFLIAHALKCLISQRLIRKTTENGYLGREAIYEILEMDDELMDSITQNRISQAFLKDYFTRKKMLAMEDIANKKLSDNITDADEITRVLG